MRRAGPSAAETPLLRVSRPVSACSRCESDLSCLNSALIHLQGRAAKIKVRSATSCPSRVRLTESFSAMGNYQPALLVRSPGAQMSVPVQTTSLQRERRDRMLLLWSPVLISWNGGLPMLDHGKPLWPCTTLAIPHLRHQIGKTLWLQ